MSKQTMYEFIEESAYSLSDLLTTDGNSQISVSGIQQLKEDLYDVVRWDTGNDDFNEFNTNKVRESVERHLEYVRNDAIPNGDWDKHLVENIAENDFNGFKGLVEALSKEEEGEYTKDNQKELMNSVKQKIAQKSAREELADAVGETGVKSKPVAATSKAMK